MSGKEDSNLWRTLPVCPRWFPRPATSTSRALPENKKASPDFTWKGSLYNNYENKNNLLYCNQIIRIPSQ